MTFVDVEYVLPVTAMLKLDFCMANSSRRNET
jgi:hypothetical protein